MKLTAERVGRTAIRISANGRAVKSQFHETKDYRRAAKELRVPLTDVQEFIDAYKAGGPAEVELSRSPASCPVTVRPLRGSNRITFPAFADALADTSLPADAEPVIEWTGTDLLCALDLDRVNGAAILTQLRPTPPWAWVTHGGGLRAIYSARPGWEADELAAAGGLWARMYDPAVRVELLPRTRHPGYARGGKMCGQVIVQPADVDAANLMAYQIGEEDIAEWLAERGMVVGTTLPHDQCLIDPRPHRRPCVFVGDDGVYCHLCASEGRSWKGRRAGFVPYRVLLGDPVPSMLRICIRNFAHIDHAAAFLPDGEKAYAAMLKAAHGPDDPRVAAAVRSRGVVRIGNVWKTVRGETLQADKLTHFLAGLPACWRVVDGEPKVNGERVELFKQNVDLTSHGYPPIRPVFGCRLYGAYLPPLDDAPSIVVPSPMLRTASRQPEPVRRMPLTTAWRIIQAVYPGINRKLIYLLLAAKGAAEGGCGMPPIIFIEGASGAGKSQSVHIAAAIAGDTATEAGYRPDLDYIYRSVAEAGSVGSFCVLNEVAKHAKTVEGFNFVLNLSPHQTYHKLYVGPSALGALPAIIMTDTQIPEEIARDRQLARRIVGVRLGSRIKPWDATLQAAGVHSTARLRVTSEELTAACDTILWAVVERWFKAPRPFVDIAKDLGYNSLLESGVYQAHLDLLRRLVALVSAVPPPRVRRTSVHMRQIPHDGELAEVWASLHDPGDWCSWSRANAEDWQSILGTEQPVECVLHKHGRHVSIGWRHPRGWYPLGLEQEPPARDDRPGDPEPGRSEDSGQPPLLASPFHPPS